MTSGFDFFRQGLKVIWRPELRLWVIIPMLINSIIYVGIIYFSFQGFGSAIDWLLNNYIPEWAHFLEWLMWPLFALTLLFIIFYTFVIIANLVAAPFNGILAEKVEALYFGETAEQGLGLREEVVHSFKREFKKLRYILPRLVLVLIVSLFLPGINAFIWIFFGAWTYAIEYCDYSVDNKKGSFDQLLNGLRSNRMTTYGFGVSVTIGMMIPLVNLVVMPAAVAGGVLLWNNKIEKREFTIPLE